MLGPIFVREWQTLPRRAWHYAARSTFLGFLWVLGVTAWLAALGGSHATTVGDNARFGFSLFQLWAWGVELPLVIFFASLSSASAVAQEKDRRTFVLLLLTDLRSHEIVLGKLFGSVLQIGILVLGSIPVLALTTLLGGVALGQIGQAVLVLLAAGLAAGSLGTLVALWRDQTFQALALTVLFLVLYLCLLRGLTFLPGIPAALVLSHLDPFEAMAQVLEPSALPAGSISPSGGFVLAMLLLTALVNACSIVLLRVWNPSERGEARRRVLPEEEMLKRSASSSQSSRSVWTNPILWREIRTRAYGHRAFLVKLAYFLVIGLIIWSALDPVFSGSGYRPAFFAAHGLVPVAVLSLLLVTAQSVTAITAERDRKALDLLLVTDLTAGEFIFGKLGGILFNVKEYLLPPLLLAGVYAWLGVLATPPKGHSELLASRNFQAMACIALGVTVLFAFGLMLGVHVGLRTASSRLAVGQALGTAFFLSVGTLACIYLIARVGRFETQWGSFVLFLAAGIGGLAWVLCGDRPSGALALAGFLCPLAMFYAIATVLVGKPGSQESASPFLPCAILVTAFGFTVAAMLVPLLSEFDVALGRTTEAGE